MTDFKRLIDEMDGDLARAVLSSGRSSPGSSSRKNQVLTALGVGLVIGTTNKLSMAALSTWQKVMFVGGVACVGAGGAMTYTHLAGPSQVAAQSAQHGPVAPMAGARALAEAPLLHQPPPSQPPPSQPLLNQPLLNQPQTEATPAAPPVAAAEPGSAMSVALPAQPNTRSSDKGIRESSVKAELGMLEQARSSLTSGNPGGALQVLARYGERYPRGSMRLEAEVLKVEALAASGRAQDASRLAERLLARNPKSVVAARLRRFASKD